MADFDVIFAGLEARCENGTEYYAKSDVVRALGGRDIRKRLDWYPKTKINGQYHLKGRIAAYQCICPELELIGNWPAYQTWEKTVMDLCVGEGLVRRVKDEVFETENTDRLKQRLQELFSLLNASRVDS